MVKRASCPFVCLSVCMSVCMYVCLSVCPLATPSFVGFLHHVLGVEMEVSAGSSGLSGKKKGGKARQPKG